ncbi:EAL domain-containing protein [Pseudomonas sp. SA3-5]|uniref:EAL domain-containing protein n=1 Tax=Pseudomonas aestuarii TaxID=3018340 RepID=A0ABT4XJA3_9PSED|nr:EAL domain-containing protein [Pseudomonas aestuarii]MDA7088299.1 EAL domain-containing protein [Pseudomonas aestuarii]
MANRILIISADAADAAVLQEVLGKAKDGLFIIEWLTCLGDALERLNTGDIDAILTALSLPDCQGLETFDQLFALVPHTPIMALCEADEELAEQAVQRGAQGYLAKGHLGSYLVAQSLRNIIQRSAVRESVLIEKARAETTLNSISNAVIATDLSGNVDYLNVAAEQMTGWSRQEAGGRPITEVMHIVNSTTRAPVHNPIQWVLEQGKPQVLSAGTILIKRDGSEAMIEDSAAPIHDANGQLSGAVIVFHDITAAQAMSVKMAHLAHHDCLTNLPNRLLLNDRIAQAITLAERHGTSLAVLFLDLDNFKHINDSLGHAIGDQLLQSVAQRLCACVRNSDTVSRPGGDEFVVLVAEEHQAQDAALTANKILSSLARPHRIAAHELHVTSSIGISIYPNDGLSAESLIKQADTAMYRAKEHGGNNFQFFRNEMNIHAHERRLVERHLRAALARQEFVLHYQPKINLLSGTLMGAEALLRWNHPQWGLVLPSRFVSIAEECGLIVPIGRWVLGEACAQAKRWQEASSRATPVAVNLSATEFRHEDFVAGVRAILSDSGLAPGNLQLEVSERVLMRNAKASIAILHQLKEMGIQIAVDDFGTGNSGLNYLSQLPIDAVKIDQSFIQAIGSANGNEAIVRTVIAMGASLNHRVIAKGIEQQSQLAFLQQQQCEEGQGYYLGRPLVAAQFSRFLRTGLGTTL